MELLKITALDTFTHGRLNMRPGDSCNIEAGEARDLERIGLVSTSKVDDDDGVDDLVGKKMEPITSNKMAPKPENKTVSKPDTGKTR